MDPRVVVERPGHDGRRRVRIGTETVGVAYGLRDLLEFLRRAGAADDVDLVHPAADWIEWRGVGPDVWP